MASSTDETVSRKFPFPLEPRISVLKDGRIADEQPGSSNQEVFGSPRSKKAKSSNRSGVSSKKKRKLLIELDANRELLELERKHAERERDLVIRKMELLKQQVDESDDDDSQDLTGYESLTERDFDDDKSPRIIVTDQIDEPESSFLQPNSFAALNLSDASGVDGALGGRGNRPNFPRETVVKGVEKETQAFDKLANAIVLAVNKSSSKSDNSVAKQNLYKDLPKFDGSPQDWPNFIAQYERSTKGGNWTNEDNIYRLQAALTGEAMKAVRPIMLGPANVPQVLETLKLRFGRPDLIIGALLKRLRERGAITDDKLGDLIELATEVNGLVDTMTNIHYEGHLTNPQLLAELVAKLTPSLRLQWGMLLVQGRDTMNLRDFAKWLDFQSRAVSMVEPSPWRQSETKPSQKYDVRKKEKPRQTNQTSLIATNESSNSAETKTEKKADKLVAAKAPRPCIICCKDHAISTCPDFSGWDSNRRWEFVKANKLCFSCLKQYHQKFKCHKKEECKIDGCKATHHKLLHNKPETVLTHMFDEIPQNRILLKVVPIKIEGPKGQMDIFALLDEGSTITLLDEGVAKKIGCKGTKETLNLSWTDQRVKKPVTVQTAEIKIGVRDDTDQFIVKNVKVMKDLRLPVYETRTITKSLSEKLMQANIPLPVERSQRPLLLIGQDNCDLIVSREVVEFGRDLPVMSRTKLGWVMHGCMQQVPDRKDATILHIRSETDEDLHRDVKEYFRIDSMGVKVPDKMFQSSENERASQMAEKMTIRVEGDRWESCLLWRQDDEKLPESKPVALSRLNGLWRKFAKEPVLAEEYKTKIADYVQKGYATELSADEEQKQSKVTWYLPHFPTTNVNKAVKKIRLVFDAASKSKGKSLNDYLIPGPDLLIPLPHALFKIRQFAIGFCGDIKEMFHQVKIRPDDLPALRFLWKDSPIGPVKTMQMKVLIFGAACAPFLAQFVRNKNAEDFKTEFPEAAKAVKEFHYMDDFLYSKETVDEAVQVIKDVVYIHKMGGFELRNFACNEPAVLECLPADQRSATDKTIKESEDTSEKILGLTWKPKQDCFTFDCSLKRLDPDLVGERRRPTKREVLRALMLIYDPLGLINPFTVKGKILLQEVWQSGIGWDDELTSRLFDKWLIWIRDLPKVASFSLPRHYAPKMKVVSRELHVFCDAGEDAMGAVAYIRSVGNCNVSCMLVMSKSRVAPLKPISIPRMELQAAIIGVRMADFIRQGHSFDIDKTYYWTDSKTVLLWLRSDARRYKSFVACRLGEILELTDETEWRWVPSSLNVADELTRDNGEVRIEENSRWTHGPKFLLLSEEEWPVETTRDDRKPSTINDAELKTEFVGTIQTEEPMMDVTRFSSWTKLLRTMAWILRFRQNCRQNQHKIKGSLLVEELREAERHLYLQSQKQAYQEELTYLDKGASVPKSSNIRDLNPFVDVDGLIKLKGRLQYAAEISDETKFPILLSPKNPITRLIIDHYHRQSYHNGQERVANEIRQKFWVTNLRAAVRKCWSDCRLCQIRRAKSDPPQMAPLPTARTTKLKRPFQTAGIDYFGPLFVKVGRRQEKRYGVLFTCLASRAIHLELAATLSSDSTIMAIRRMGARRGYPTTLYSDCGTNFKGADREIRQAVRENNDGVAADMANRGIKWVFNPAATPHMGGSWE